ncbi:MAG: response regulator [Chromatiales bacterium]|nr:response regulator [Chromatiales bacterium]
MSKIGSTLSRLFSRNSDSDKIFRKERRKNYRNTPDDGTQILIIDDSKTAQQLLKKMFTQAGYDVLQGFDGESGIALAQQHKPALIIMDVVMPGISGFQATRMIRKDPEIADIPIIITSGSRDASDQFWLSKIGADHYLTKPFTRGDLFLILDKVLYSEVLVKDWSKNEMLNEVVEPDQSYAEINLHIGHEMEILIIDDSKTVQYLMKKMLMQRGYDVLQAYDGKSGIILAKKHKPSLIIMDVMMPGMNGFQATRFIRNDADIADIPIVIISGNKQASEKFWAAKLGASHYMAKPFTRSDLFKTLDKTLHVESVTTTPANGIVINTVVEPDPSYTEEKLDID